MKVRIRVRHNIIHLLWTEKNLNGSKIQKEHTLKLKNTVRNKTKALLIARDFEKVMLDKEKEKLKIKQDYGFKTIAESWNDFLRKRTGNSIATIKDYNYFYKNFTRHFEENQSCFSINKETFENWILQIKSLPLSQNTIHLIVKNGKHYLKHLFKNCYIPVFYVDDYIRTPKQQVEIIVFDIEDLKIIIRNLHKKNLNFQLLINMLFFTGLRPSDLLNIREVKGDIMKYYSPKRKKDFIIPIHRDLESAISLLGWEIKYSTVQEIAKAFHKYLNQINLQDKGYSVRTFRKTFSTYMYERGVDELQIDELVNHIQQTVGRRHYILLSETKLREAVNKYFSIAELLN